jgi:hypothetical protein
MKTCVRCQSEKPTIDFPKAARTRDHLSSFCKSCHLAATRQWRAEHHDELLARRREQAAKLRAEAAETVGDEIAAILARPWRPPSRPRV